MRMMNGVQAKTTIALILLLLLLSACGFHLRGGVELPPVLQVTYIQSKEPFAGISPPLRDTLQSAGAQVTEEANQATGVIRIVSERSERRVLSVGSAGRASEYELFEEVVFSLSDAQGKVLIEPQAVRTIRDLVFDENQVLGKVSEAEDLREEMRRSIAKQIIMRIYAGTR